jgi:CCR4-NOT transcription complex subunit 1
VVYVASQGVIQLQNKMPLQGSPAMDIFKQMVAAFDAEGRYHIFNAMANQLRYPNSHTHYFYCVLLTLFADAESEAVQELITRVLLERLIVHRPHPVRTCLYSTMIIFEIRLDAIAHPNFNLCVLYTPTCFHAFLATLFFRNIRQYAKSTNTS